MMGRKAVNLILLLALCGIAAVGWTVQSDPSQPNDVFLPNMVESVPYDAFAENPNYADGKTLQPPPDGAIPRGAVRLHYSTGTEEAKRAGQELRNPFLLTDTEAVRRGSVIYGRYCGVCHGGSGKGDGPVAMRGIPAAAGVHGRQVGRHDRWRDIPHAHLRRREHAFLRDTGIPGGSMESHPVRSHHPAEGTGGGSSGRGTGAGTLAVSGGGGAASAVMTSAIGLAAPVVSSAAARVCVVIGVLSLIAGAFLSPASVWPYLLLLSYAMIGLGLGAVAFMALQYIVGSGWSAAFRRVPEAMVAAMPLGFVGLWIVFLAYPSTYPWHGVEHDAAPGVAWFKDAWLSWPFFLVRAARVHGALGGVRVRDAPALAPAGRDGRRVAHEVEHPTCRRGFSPRSESRRSLPASTG